MFRIVSCCLLKSTMVGGSSEVEYITRTFTGVDVVEAMAASLSGRAPVKQRDRRAERLYIRIGGGNGMVLVNNSPASVELAEAHSEPKF